MNLDLPTETPEEQARQLVTSLGTKRAINYVISVRYCPGPGEAERRWEDYWGEVNDGIEDMPYQHPPEKP